MFQPLFVNSNRAFSPTASKAIVVKPVEFVGVKVAVPPATCIVKNFNCPSTPSANVRAFEPVE